MARMEMDCNLIKQANGIKCLPNVSRQKLSEMIIKMVCSPFKEIIRFVI